MSFPSLARDGRLVRQDFPQTVRRTVIVDSRDRNHDAHPSSSDFSVRLHEPVKNVSSAVLVSAELPLSYYVFSAARGTNSLTVVHNGTPATVTIRDGNYSTATMAAELKRVLDAAFSPVTFTVTFDASSMRCTLQPSSGTAQVDTGTTPTAITFTVRYGGRTESVSVTGTLSRAAVATALQNALNATFAPATFTAAFAGGAWSLTPSAGTASLEVTDRSPRTDWGLGYYLGFDRNVVTVAAASVTGPRVATLNPENYLLIHIDELNGISQARTNDQGPGAAAFAKVPLNGDSYQYNYYDKTLTPVDLRPLVSSLEKLRVSIRFHDGTLVDLNGAEWSMCIEFTGTLARGL